MEKVVHQPLPKKSTEVNGLRTSNTEAANKTTMDKVNTLATGSMERSMVKVL